LTAVMGRKVAAALLSVVALLGLTASRTFRELHHTVDFLTSHHDTNFEFSFEEWMANANIEASSSEGLAELRPKLVKRLLIFCRDMLPAAVWDQYKAEIPDDLNIEPARKLTSIEKSAQAAVLADAPSSSNKADQFREFGFLPQHIGRAIRAGADVTWESRCWKSASVSVAEADGAMKVSVKVSRAKAVLCSEMFLFTSASAIRIGIFSAPFGGTKTVEFPLANLTDSEVWDLKTLGVRVFQFRDGPVDTVTDILETVLMFLSDLTKSVPASIAERNVNFLRRYRGVDMAPRQDPGGVMLNETEIHSGDFLGVIRLDGLDPMLAWGMGATTGHTTVALWEEGELYIAESTVNGSYWPTNGIQRTKYSTWITQAREAGYSVVHAPLAPKYRSLFNESAANEFFHRHAGLNYGYSNMLWGWIDTQSSNFPCLPPYPSSAESYCLTWPLVESLFPFLGKYIAAVNGIFLESFNQHVTGSAFTGLSATDVYRRAESQNISTKDIPRIVEKDMVQYSQTWNNGTQTKDISMVCDVFVCFIWKAAGVFAEIDSDFNCVEQTNNDVYDLDVLTVPESRPAACVAADPNNTLCQLMGAYELKLPNLGTRKPYKHMQESCPTLPPLYDRPSDC